MKSVIYGTFMVLGVIACVSFAAPEPAVVQGPGLYTVDVKFEHPQQLLVQGQGGPQVLWYTIVTLTNRTGGDVDFYPRCELVTDTFEIVPAGRLIPAGAFEMIKRRHSESYPFLEALEKSGNQVLQGRDNSKDIAVIWRDFDTEAKGIKLYVSGLSNETAAVARPRTSDTSAADGMVYLRKTLEMSYSLRGDPALRPHVELTYKGKNWVMR